MRKYLEQRIEELNKKYDEYQLEYIKTTNEHKANVYYTRLYALEKTINELEKVLAMVKAPA